MAQFIFSLFFLFGLFCCSLSAETITLSASLMDNQTVVSAAGTFELGFFKLGGNPLSKYLGIWYKQIPVRTVVWIANRDGPLVNSTGVLSLVRGRGLVLKNHLDQVLWTTANSTRRIASDGIKAQLLDSGNLVVLDSSQRIVWQSFDYPTDTMLPGMRVGRSLKTGVETYLSSWRSSNDPSTGEYSYKLASSGPIEFVTYQGSKIFHSSGLWNGVQLTGNPTFISDNGLEFNFVTSSEEVYYILDVRNNSILSRLVMNWTGSIQRYLWSDSVHEWQLYWEFPADACSYYGVCGTFGMCYNPSPTCKCLQGFTPKDPREWSLRDWSEGCVRRTSLSCNTRDEFLVVNQTKLPESTSATVNMSMNLDECRQSCLSNCSCRAYASANVSGGEKGCIIWNTDLMDMMELDLNSQNLYVRIAASELNSSNMQTLTSIRSGISSAWGVVIAVASSLVALGLTICGYWMWRKKRRSQYPQGGSLGSPLGGEEVVELSLSFSTIVAATDGFCAEHKLGEGGFGPVYKGRFQDGQFIAVKRLAKNSGQGVDEFKNEVMVIAKLQHRNLVRLLGCCIHGEERILVYEYLENKSLDAFLFADTCPLSMRWMELSQSNQMFSASV